MSDQKAPLVPMAAESSQHNDRAHAQSISSSEMVDYYAHWADYDVDLGPANYRGPAFAADAVRRHMGDYKSNARVLDLAAGTGFVAEHLQKYGFEHVDGLEPAGSMLEDAQRKGIRYEHKLVQMFEETNPSIDNDSYDVVVSSGGLGQGHIPCNAIEEMARIVKPGGVVVIVMREAYLTSVGDYTGRLEPLMAAMETRGVWTSLERTVVQNYSFENNGVIFVFKVL